MWKGMKWMYLSLRRKAHIRLTKAGWLFAASTLALGLAAVNTGDNLVYLVVSFLLAAMATASFWAYLNFARLEADVEGPPTLFRNEPVPFEIVLSNHKPFPSFLIGVGLPPLAPTLSWVFYIPPRGTQRIWVRLRFPRRGLFHLEALRIRSAFPFGLAYRTEDRSLSRTVLVYPAVHTVRGDPPASILATQTGAQSTSREGTGGDFLGLRPFVRGDSPRRIYWRSFYRERRLEIKRFGEEASTTTLLRLPKGASEETIETIASWVVALIQRGNSVGLVVEETGEHFPPRPGEAQKHRLLRALALYPNPSMPTRRCIHQGGNDGTS